MKRKFWLEFILVFSIFIFIPYVIADKLFYQLCIHKGAFPLNILFLNYSSIKIGLPLISLLVLSSRFLIVFLYPLFVKSLATPFKYWCSYQGAVFGTVLSLVFWALISPKLFQRMIVFQGDFFLISIILGAGVVFLDARTKKIISEKRGDPLFAEQPIETEDEDVIRIGPVVDEIVAAIRKSFEGKRKLIAIFGKNGIGKSSAVNLVRNKLKGDRLLFSDFEPYRYTHEKEMIKSFFSAMLDPLDKKYVLPGANTISKKLTTILSGFSGEVPVIKFDLGKLGEWFDESDDFTSLKTTIEQYLLDLDEKIVIIVDDLDRCSIRKRHLFFQLVSAIKNLENIVIVITASVDELLELKEPEIISIVD